MSLTTKQIDAVATQAETMRLYNAYQSSVDSDNRSQMWKDYQAARIKSDIAHEALIQQQYLANLKDGKYDAWEKSQGQRPGALLAAAMGDTSFIQPPPVSDPNDPTVVGGTPPSKL